MIPSTEKVCGTSSAGIALRKTIVVDWREMCEWFDVSVNMSGFLFLIIMDWARKKNRWKWKG